MKTTLETSEPTTTVEQSAGNETRCLTLPVLAWTVQSDGRLDERPPRAGFLREISARSAKFDLVEPLPLSRALVALGVECPDSVTRYAGLSIRERNDSENGTSYQASFDGIAHGVLQERCRHPFLDEVLFQYRFPFPTDVYESWEAAGLLKRSVLDRVMLCPRCRSVPTFRFACRNCRSGRLDHSLLIHHFPCAFVAPSTDFEREGDLVCPKCLTKKLVAGTDFEFMPGEFRCRSCGWRDQDLEQTGHCLNCETRFAAHQAAEEELVGYDAERLDPLALLSDVE